jgi:hypothetical protein
LSFWVWLVFAVPLAGYLVALVATVRRSSWHFGQGMLGGLTLLLLGALLVVVMAAVLLDDQFTWG